MGQENPQGEYALAQGEIVWGTALKKATRDVADSDRLHDQQSPLFGAVFRTMVYINELLPQR